MMINVKYLICLGTTCSDKNVCVIFINLLRRLSTVRSLQKQLPADNIALCMSIAAKGMPIQL